MKNIILILVVISLFLVSCNDHLEISQIYRFNLETMPVVSRIKKGETVEIRCQITREGNYNGTKFFIRYFQPDGEGVLRLKNTVFAPNDLYNLSDGTFRLYYTSASEDQQTIDIYVEDSFGQVVQKSFSFTNKTEPKE